MLSDLQKQQLKNAIGDTFRDTYKGDDAYLGMGVSSEDVKEELLSIIDDASHESTIKELRELIMEKLMSLEPGMQRDVEVDHKKEGTRLLNVRVDIAQALLDIRPREGEPPTEGPDAEVIKFSFGKLNKK